MLQCSRSELRPKLPGFRGLQMHVGSGVVGVRRQIHTHLRLHRYTHSHVCLHTCIHIHLYLYIYSYMYNIYTLIRLHACIRAHTHTCAHAHVCGTYISSCLLWDSQPAKPIAEASEQSTRTRVAKSSCLLQVM